MADKTRYKPQVTELLGKLLTKQLVRSLACRLSLDDVLLERLVDHVIDCLEELAPAGLVAGLRADPALRSAAKTMMIAVLQHREIYGGD